MDVKDLTELLEQYQAAVNVSDGVALSTFEISNLTGWSQAKASRHVRALVLAGLMRSAGRKSARSVDGSMRPVPVYEIVKKEKTKTKNK